MAGAHRGSSVFEQKYPAEGKHSRVWEKTGLMFNAANQEVNSIEKKQLPLRVCRCCTETLIGFSSPWSGRTWQLGLSPNFSLDPVGQEEKTTGERAEIPPSVLGHSESRASALPTELHEGKSWRCCPEGCEGRDVTGNCERESHEGETVRGNSEGRAVSGKP